VKTPLVRRAASGLARDITHVRTMLIATVNGNQAIGSLTTQDNITASTIEATVGTLIEEFSVSLIR